jgi:hypothetical protein
VIVVLLVAACLALVASMVRSFRFSLVVFAVATVVGWGVLAVIR